MKNCDLHTHSYYSDGSYSPVELIDEALKLGLSAIALTDHNTTSGLDEFLSAANGKPIIAIPGIEFSTDYAHDNTVTELHMLALFIPPESYGEINARVSTMMQRKRLCNEELVKALQKAGYCIDYEAICAIHMGTPNRANIAEALMNAGYVSSIKEAFSSLLSVNGPYYKAPARLDVFETVSFIKSVGAVAVLAHPFLNLSVPELREFLKKAVPAGLDAMETIYSTYDKETILMAKKIAQEFNILESGGSDFHGTRKPHIALGSGEGSLDVPSQVFEILKLKRRQL